MPERINRWGENKWMKGVKSYRIPVISYKINKVLRFIASILTVVFKSKINLNLKIEPVSERLFWCGIL